MAERLKAPVLKTGVGASPPWVRIPPHPPDAIEIIAIFGNSGFQPTLQPTNAPAQRDLGRGYPRVAPIVFWRMGGPETRAA